MPYDAIEFDCHGDRQQVLDLWCRNLPQGSPARYAWLYEAGPASGWLLHSDPGQAVGATGVMVRRMRALGCSVRAGQAIDMNVDRDHRTIGPALGLQRALTDAAGGGRFDLLYALPNEQSSAVLRRIGYRHLGAVERWTLPLRSERLLRVCVRHPLARKLAAAVADTAASFRRGGYPRRGSISSQVHVTDRFDARFDDLWQEASPQHVVVGERTSEYLAWRFGRSPEGRYRTFTLSNEAGRLLAYLVYCRREGTVHLNDFFFADRDDLRFLLAAFVRRMHEERAEAVTAVYLGPPGVSEVFRRSGFFRGGSPWNAMVYASGRHWGSAGGSLFQKDNWYLTRADVDTDV